MKQLKINAEWDNESAVWVASSDDVLGLELKADTIDSLIVQLKTLIPKLMGLSGLDLSGNDLPFELIKTWPVRNSISC